MRKIKIVSDSGVYGHNNQLRTEMSEINHDEVNVHAFEKSNLCSTLGEDHLLRIEKKHVKLKIKVSGIH